MISSCNTAVIVVPILQGKDAIILKRRSLHDPYKRTYLRRHLKFGSKTSRPKGSWKCYHAKEVKETVKIEVSWNPRENTVLTRLHEDREEERTPAEYVSNQNNDEHFDSGRSFLFQLLNVSLQVTLISFIWLWSEGNHRRDERGKSHCLQVGLDDVSIQLPQVNTHESCTHDVDEDPQDIENIVANRLVNNGTDIKPPAVTGGQSSR